CVRNFSVVTLVVACVLCLVSARQSPAQGNGTQHSSGAFSVVFFNDCTGELVDIDVTYKSDFHVVVDKAGGFHLDVHDVYSGRGVGETSGTVYIANQTDTISENAKAGFEVTEPLHFSMVSKGDRKSTRLNSSH